MFATAVQTQVYQFKLNIPFTSFTWFIGYIFVFSGEWFLIDYVTFRERFYLYSTIFNRDRTWSLNFFSSTFTRSSQIISFSLGAILYMHSISPSGFAPNIFVDNGETGFSFDILFALVSLCVRCIIQDFYTMIYLTYYPKRDVSVSIYFNKSSKTQMKFKLILTGLFEKLPFIKFQFMNHVHRSKFPKLSLDESNILFCDESIWTYDEAYSLDRNLSRIVFFSKYSNYELLSHLILDSLEQEHANLPIVDPA